MAGRTQEALYAALDLDLSWSEADLPQAERTKHVHGLHPYLGKFVPQLVEVFLQRLFEPGQRVLDPFCGSGTTLVEANSHGCGALGIDISAFNCLVARVKTAAHDLPSLEPALADTLDRAVSGRGGGRRASQWARRWYSPTALAELLAYREAACALPEHEREVAFVVLSRAARSARRTTHFDLDFPAAPVTGPYWCHKHRRECSPVDEAAKFLRRYTADTIARLRAFAAVRSRGSVEIVHGDARLCDVRADGVITSPPYPGLIDYHEQHRYAYELLGLTDRRDEEIGPAVRGRARGAQQAYVEATAAVFRRVAAGLPEGAPVVIVVNDSHGLYPQILELGGLVLDERLRRHVNRRTGRRNGEFFEDVLVCRAGTGPRPRPARPPRR